MAKMNPNNNTDWMAPSTIRGNDTLSARLGKDLTVAEVLAMLGIGVTYQSIINSGSAISLSSATPTDITSLTLPAGEWCVFGNVSFTASVGAQFTTVWTSSTSATLPDKSLYNTFAATTAITGEAGFSAPYRKFSLGATTTIYLGAYATFASGTVSACGGLYAVSASTFSSVQLPSGTQFNTQSFTLTSATTINSAVFTNTGLAVTITPTSASNTVLVRGFINVGMSTTNINQFALFRNGTIIGGARGDAAGVRTQGTSSVYTDGNVGNSIVQVYFEYEDSPASASALTYELYVLTATPSPVGINQTITDSNSGTFPRCVSTITACEIQA